MLGYKLFGEGRADGERRRPSKVALGTDGKRVQFKTWRWLS